MNINNWDEYMDDMETGDWEGIYDGPTDKYFETIDLIEEERDEFIIEMENSANETFYGNCFREKMNNKVDYFLNKKIIKHSLSEDICISYQEQLEHDKWIEKSIKIREKLKFCQVCGSDENLHVHHKKYIEGRKAWEYEDDDLDLLCNECHMDEHYSAGVPVYNRFGNLKYIAIADLDNLLVVCDRCGGEGIIPIYMHVENGICFKCRGNRYFNIKSFHNIYIT